jgi:hypothetical protein
MPGPTPRNKRLVTFCAILFILAIMPVLIGNSMANLGMFQFMQIMAAGVALGVMITAVGHTLNTTTTRTT